MSNKNLKVCLLINCCFLHGSFILLTVVFSVCSTCLANQEALFSGNLPFKFLKTVSPVVFIFKSRLVPMSIEPVSLNLLNVFANSLNRIEKPNKPLSNQDPTFLSSDNLTEIRVLELSR